MAVVSWSDRSLDGIGELDDVLTDEQHVNWALLVTTFLGCIILIVILVLLTLSSVVKQVDRTRLALVAGVLALIVLLLIVWRYSSSAHCRSRTLTTYRITSRGISNGVLPIQDEKRKRHVDTVKHPSIKERYQEIP